MSMIQNSTVGNVSVPLGCHVVTFEETEFVPWDNADNIVSAEVEDVTRRLKNTILLPILFLIGGPANVINMAVFYKQGLKDRVNLCLFALSLADELYLIQAMFLYGEQLHLQFTTKERFGPMMRFIANNNLVGFYGFTWVSQALSAIIASERCICVLSPLRFLDSAANYDHGCYRNVNTSEDGGAYVDDTKRYCVACVFNLASETLTLHGVADTFYQNQQELINTSTVLCGALS